MYENNYKVIIRADIASLYDMLKDIDSYPSIIPYIKSVQYNHNDTIPIHAHVILEHFLIKLEYDCDIYFNDANHSVKINGYGYSFEKIDGFWNLRKISEIETEVTYKLRFQMKNIIKQKVVEKVFSLYERKMQEKIKDYLDRAVKKKR